MVQRFGIVGYGVVGSLFARLLRQHGACVISCDILLDREDTATALRRRILADGGEVGTFDEVLGSSDYILSVTPPQSCREVAARASRALRTGQVYCDLASTSPAAKKEMAAESGANGAHFVEGVILGAVNGTHSSPAILLGGVEAERTAAALQKNGLRARFYSPEIGQASAFKMIRSVFSKGMEALLIETLVAARRADLFDDVWQEIKATLAVNPVEKTLENWIRSHAISSGRRYCEMQEVGEFLSEIGLAPVMAHATADVFRRSNELEMSMRFPEEPERFEDVIEYLERGAPLQ